MPTPANSPAGNNFIFLSRCSVLTNRSGNVSDKTSQPRSSLSAESRVSNQPYKRTDNNYKRLAEADGLYSPFICGIIYCDTKFWCHAYENHSEVNRANHSQ